MSRRVQKTTVTQTRLFETFELEDFELKIFEGEEESIIFNVSEKDDLSGTLYKIELNLEEIHDLNKVFRQYDTIYELFTEFFQNLDESKFIIEKEENKINLIIVVEFMGKKK